MLEVVEDLPESLVVAVVAISGVIRCSACGHKTARVHATRKVEVADLAVSGRPVTLVWHRRRFRCKRCRTTTTETHPFFVDRMTKRLARAVVADARDMTVAAVARRHGLSWHRVMRLVLAEGELLARARRRRPCRVLLVDEKSMRKGRGQFSTILTDGDRGRVIAVLKGRSADVLGGFLAAQSPSWRAGVSVVVTDMAECYRVAVRKHLPHARHVADRFHVVRGFAKVLVTARRDAQRSPLGEPHDAEVFRARFLLMKRLDRLSGEEMARLGALFDAHPELGVVWGLVQRFHVDVLRRERHRRRASPGLVHRRLPGGGHQPGIGHHHVLSVGRRVAQLPPDRSGHQRRLGGGEHPHRGAGAHGLRVRLESQLPGPGVVVLLRSPAGAGELMPASPMMTVKPVRTVRSPGFSEEPKNLHES